MTETSVIYAVKRALSAPCEVSAQANGFGTIDIRVSWYAHGKPFHHMASFSESQLAEGTARDDLIARFVAQMRLSIERSTA